MEKYRNPMTRPTNFSNPAGNVVKEMDAAEYSKIAVPILSLQKNTIIDILYWIQQKVKNW